jgi:hypothetical protein
MQWLSSFHLILFITQSMESDSPYWRKGRNAADKKAKTDIKGELFMKNTKLKNYTKILEELYKWQFQTKWQSIRLKVN